MKCCCLGLRFRDNVRGRVVWGYIASPLCDCGEHQTMRQIVNECRWHDCFDGGISELHQAHDAVFKWAKWLLRQNLRSWKQTTTTISKKNYKYYRSTCMCNYYSRVYVFTINLSSGKTIFIVTAMCVLTLNKLVWHYIKRGFCMILRCISSWGFFFHCGCSVVY